MKPVVKKSLLAFIALLVICGVVLVIYQRVLLGIGKQNTDNAYVQSNIAVISAEVAGQVKGLRVDDNQMVNAGDILVELDDTLAKAQLLKAEAQVARVEAAMVNLDKRILLQQDKIQQSRASVTNAEVELRRSEADLQRSKELINKGWTSARENDQFKASADSSVAKLAQVQAELAAQQKQLAVLDSEQTTLDTGLQEAKANVLIAQKQLQDTQVLAPVSGMVGNRLVSNGNYIKAGSALMSIVPLDELWVEANFKETQLEYILPGQSTEIHLDSFPGQLISGQVMSLSPASGAEFSLFPAQNATGNFIKVVQRLTVKIAMQIPPELHHRIRPGMSAEISIDTNSLTLSTASH